MSFSPVRDIFSVPHSNFPEFAVQKYRPFFLPDVPAGSVSLPIPPFCSLRDQGAAPFAFRRPPFLGEFPRVISSDSGDQAAVFLALGPGNPPAEILPFISINISFFPPTLLSFVKFLYSRFCHDFRPQPFSLCSPAFPDVLLMPPTRCDFPSRRVHSSQLVRPLRSL